MSELARVSIAAGGILLLIYGTFALAPAMARDGLKRFSRHQPSAWILTALALFWSGWLLYHSPLGRLEAYRALLFVIVPAAVVLVGLFADELLAPRALGGLLIIVPAVLLDAARWHRSPWRYVMILLAYALVIKGCVLVVAPYMFRKQVEFRFPTEAHVRGWGIGGMGLAVLLIVLGLLVY